VSLPASTTAAAAAAGAPVLTSRASGTVSPFSRPAIAALDVANLPPASATSSQTPAVAAAFTPPDAQPRRQPAPVTTPAPLQLNLEGQQPARSQGNSGGCGGGKMWYIPHRLASLVYVDDQDIYRFVRIHSIIDVILTRLFQPRVPHGSFRCLL
jgi:hypothetical protein